MYLSSVGGNLFTGYLLMEKISTGSFVIFTEVKLRLFFLRLTLCCDAVVARYWSKVKPYSAWFLLCNWLKTILLFICNQSMTFSFLHTVGGY